MKSFLLVLTFAACALVALFVPIYGAPAVMVCIPCAAIAVLAISRAGSDRDFLLRLFVGALLVRMAVGVLIFVFGMQDFFGGDAFTYDFYGQIQLKAWSGERYYQTLVQTFYGREGSGGGWGMLYMVGALYSLVGRNMLATQLVNAVIGAATGPVIFLIAQQVFGNIRVSRLSAFFVAFYPSLVLWSSQGLKDGPIVFLLAISMLATLKLGEKFSLKYLAILGLALFGLLSLRFYVFYMAVASIGMAFVVGMRALTAQTAVRQVVVIVTIGLMLGYLGISRYATVQFENYGSLQAVQTSRLDAAQSANSGFAKDTDVSTTFGAITAIPLGIVYLLFAPFPWQLASLRQSITLPEMIVWWASFPALVLGLWFAVKYRLRQILPILIFTVMLTLAYSVFQGNIGNAYRQRAQLLVFYFIFVAVGIILFKERRENRMR